MCVGGGNNSKLMLKSLKKIEEVRLLNKDNMKGTVLIQKNSTVEQNNNIPWD